MASDDSFEQPAPRRFPKAALVAVAFVMAAVIGFVVRQGSGGGQIAVEEQEPPPEVSEPEPVPDPEPAPEPEPVDGADDGAGAEVHEAGGSWSELVEAPLSPRRVAPVWTGRELVVWGGQRDGLVQRPFHDDGAAYDPETGEWRELPDSPLGARGGHVAVWAAGQVLIWGGQDRVRFHDDGAAYDPETDAWTAIPPGPLSPRSEAVAAWIDGELVVVGGVDGAGYLSDAAAYDPERRRWRGLDEELPVGVGTPEGRAAVLDDRLVLWSSGRMGTDASPMLRYYEPGDDRWGDIELPGILADVGHDQWITATDDALVAVSAQGPGGRPRMAVHDGHEWEDVIAPTGSRGPPGTMANPFTRAAVSDGDRVYVLDDVREPLRYDLAASTWSALPPIEPASVDGQHLSQHYQAVPVDAGVLVWLGGVAGEDALGDGSPAGVVVWQPEE